MWSMNKGMTYFHRDGFSINEGGTPFNCHVSWAIWPVENDALGEIEFKRIWHFYVYIFGFRWGKMLHGRQNYRST